MHYYVDGYNLLFRTLPDDEDFQKEREDLITDLAEKVMGLHLDVTVVFDSAYQVGDATKGHRRFLEVVYTAAGETADAYILSELQVVKDVRHEIVVTSDKGLASRCRNCGAKTMSVEGFAVWLNQRYRRKTRQPIKKVLKLPSPPPVPSRSPAPAPAGTSDHYEQLFEKRLEELIEEEQHKPSVKASTTRQAIKQREQRAPKEAPELDTDRWLRLFEKRLQEESE